jgi:hypothetical protein
MAELEITETTESLIKAAHEAGYLDVTKRHIARWHRAGLLPLPHTEYLGKPKGTCSHYRADARARLLAFLPYRLGRKLRPIPDLLWHLFAAGFEIEEKYLRPKLVRLAEQFEGMTQHATQLTQDDAAGRCGAAARLVDSTTSLSRDRKWRQRFGMFLPARHYPQVVEMIGGQVDAGGELLSAIAPAFGDPDATDEQAKDLGGVLAVLRSESFLTVATETEYAELQRTTVELSRQARQMGAALGRPFVSTALGLREPTPTALQYLFAELYHPLFVLWILAERRFAPAPVVGPVLRQIADLAGPA